MKKLVLAPAVAVVAGALAFAGTPAFAAPTTECSNNTLNAKQGAQCTITLDADKVSASTKAVITVSNLPAGAKIKSVEALNNADSSIKLYTRVDQLAKTPTFEVYGVDGLTGGDNVKNPNGDYTVNITLEDGTKVNAGVIRYIDKDNAVAGDPELSAQFDKYHVSSFRAVGMLASYKNLEGNEDFTWVLKHKESGKTSTGTFHSNRFSKDGGTFYAKVEGADKMSDSELMGAYTLTVKDKSGKTLDTSLSFSVVTDREDVGTPQPNNPEPGEGGKPEQEAAKYGLKVSPKGVTPGDFVKKDKGVQLTVTGLKPNEKFRYSVSKKDGGKVEGLFKEVQANKDGVWSYTVYGQESSNGLSGFLGSYNVTVKSEEGVLTDSFKVTNTPGKKDNAPKPEKPKPEEEAPKPNNPKPGEGGKPEQEAAKYGLKVSPKEVTPGDFVKKDKGVTLVVTGLKPNEKFRYSVSKQDGGKVKTLFKEVQANKDGVWSFTVYGQEGSNGLSGFLGTYKVTVKSEEGVLTDTFTVTNTPGKKDDAKPGDKGDGKDNGDAKGGDNKNTGNDSGQSNNAKGNGKSSNALPRTGMELSGLIAGGVLLTVGAATVLVTRRRVK
ncbi:hypothetical protein [Brevibacterium paucivorans]|uniref:hypothetical protein n=2 Tax=Brevibacterium TaxID=1696 RepID=UPI00321AD584